MKGVLATVEDSAMEDALIVHVDRLAFSSARLRAEIDPSVSFDSAFRSLYDPSLHYLFGDTLWSNLI